MKGELWEGVRQVGAGWLDVNSEWRKNITELNEEIEVKIKGAYRRGI